MVKIPVVISDLRKKVDGDTVKKLADYLEEKLGVDFDLTGSEIVLNYEEENPVSRSHLRVLLRKFLHREELKDFRVIAGKEDAFIIKEKKVTVEE
ncbi:hypothetical protein KAX01_03815 [Candidatus Bathyarchaeota archaeon]|nr:hypothetical protein [Candidatus Bathyarchaeota archaeon]MCK4435457.1 hypothetical protein [Candidatus Bathyarchaeota archaeon]TET12004.1 MAG: hypothetical protein E3J82_04995 [Candidatus Thorarchaeota archaeon]